MKIFKTLMVFVFVWAIAFQNIGQAETGTDVNLVLGDLETIPVKKVTRISITNPDIADISDAKSDKILILAKRPGQTSLFYWDEEGKHTVYLHVVGEDLKAVQDRIAKLFEEANIKTITSTINSAEGKVVLAGDLAKEQKQSFEKILEPYGDQIINLVKEEAIDDLVQIDMQITELSSNLTKNLGFDWSATQMKYTESGVPFNTGSKDWFKFGQFNRTNSITNAVNLSISEGKARDLSRPRILVSSGKEATINVGGEVPIKSTTTNAAGGSLQESVSFKQYGVTLTVTPTIKDDNRVDVVMNVQITDVDKSFVVPASTTSDVAYKTRSAQTQLLLDDRQTVVFAGLLRYSDSDTVKRVPFLSKFPIVGGLFKNRSNAGDSPDEARDVVIILTPTIVHKKEYAKDEIKFHDSKMVNFEKEIDIKQQYEREPLPVINKGEQPAVPASTAVEQFNPAAMELQKTYVQSVQAKLAKAIVYPEEGLKDNWQGAAKIRLLILKDGSLGDAAVVKSSGQEVFDKAALNSAKKAAPYPPFPAEMRQDDLYVTLPIEYKNTLKAIVEPVKAEPVPAASKAEDQKVMYVRDVQVKISKSISYPYEALKNDWQGTVRLKLHVLKDGALADATIDQSSGHSVFDKDALNSAKVAAPFAAFTTDMKSEDMFITIPIVYSNSSVSKPEAQASTAGY